MKRLIVFACIFSLWSISSNAQPSPKLQYFKKVPASIDNCGAVYTYDTVALQKKKYIFLTDFQNLALLTINDKQIKLQLTDTKTSNKTNISTYKGAGYNAILSSITTTQKGGWDLETGSLQVTSGSKKIIIKIHGQSHCDESKQEGNL